MNGGPRPPIRIVHHSASLSPTQAEFPPSTQYVKTLVTIKKSKVSEFSYELTVNEGDILALDTEPMSNDLKKAVMSNFTLPLDWLVCVTATGEKRLIRKNLATKVEDTQARMYQLKKAAGNLLQSLAAKSDKRAEIGKQIHELIGTNAPLMKYFADQLLEAMKSSTEWKMRGCAAHALSHYMVENKDFVGYLETKSEHFLKFADDTFSSEESSPDAIDHVCTLLKDWCTAFPSKREFSQLLDNINVDRNFKRDIRRVINVANAFKIEETKTKIRNKLITAANVYFTRFYKAEKIHRLVNLLLVKLNEGEKTHQLEIILNVFYLASFMFEVSETFKTAFVGDQEIQRIYKENWKEFDKERHFQQWFPQPESYHPPRQEAAPPPEPRLVHVAPVARAAPTPPQSPNGERVYENVQPPLPPKPGAPPKPKPRTVPQVKNRKKAEIDPLSRLSHGCQDVLSTMDKMVPSYRESELKVLKEFYGGSFGQIQLVKANSVGVFMVAKKLFAGKSLTENALKEEANLLKCVSHPHIVRIVGKILSDCLPYQIIGILMEYMEGGNLYQTIHNPKDNFDEWQTLTWMEHIASALRFLHDNHLVHRDIKPANMLLTSSTKPRDLKLCDFGMLKSVKVNETGALSRPVGTPGYLAPETAPIWGEGVYSTSVDIYSFAMTIWEMVQRKKLHESMMEQPAGVPQRRPSLREPRYPWLAGFVTKMWQSNPSLRPAIVEIQEDIERTLQERCRATPI